jgi:hypothetical protein
MADGMKAQVQKDFLTRQVVKSRNLTEALPAQ